MLFIAFCFFFDDLSACIHNAAQFASPLNFFIFLVRVPVE